jgi:hypothetical protein
MRLIRLDRVCTAELRVHPEHHVGPDAGERVLPHDACSSLEHGDPVAARRVAPVECRVDPADHTGGCKGDEEGREDGEDGKQPEVLQDQQQRRAQAEPDPRVAGEGQRDRHQQCRQDERGPDAIAPPEEQACHGGACDQHQEARVGHVVAEQTPWTAAQPVVVQDSVLDDADDGAGGRDRDDDVEHRVRARTPSQVVHGWHDQQQDELLAVDNAHARVPGEGGRDQRPARVHHQRPEHRRHAGSLPVHQQEHGPRHEHERQQDIGRGDGELERGHEAEQGREAHELDAITGRCARRDGEG